MEKIGILFLPLSEKRESRENVLSLKKRKKERRKDGRKEKEGWRSRLVGKVPNPKTAPPSCQNNTLANLK